MSLWALGHCNRHVSHFPDILWIIELVGLTDNGNNLVTDKVCTMMLFLFVAAMLEK